MISDRIKTQLSIESARKIQTWAIALAGLLSLMTAINLLSAFAAKGAMDQTKVLFLTLFHLTLAVTIYLPEWLQKGDKVLPRLLGIRDFTSLTFVALTLTLVSYYVFSISQQLAAAPANSYEARSGLVTFDAWLNILVTGTYLVGLIFYFASLFFFPQALKKVLDKMGTKRPVILLSVHGTLFLLGYFTYTSTAQIGSSLFFEELRLAGCFLIFTASSVFVVGKLLEESSVASLTSLHMEVASGKFERAEDILSRIKQAFISKRLSLWISRISLETAKKSHEIAEYLHQSVSTIELDRPSEAQLGQTEERYRKSSQIYKKLEQAHQRFLLNISFFSLQDGEREKVEELKDQFSKELRHAKLELASVRKRIDDKLHEMKDRERPEPPVERPLEQVTISG